MNRAAYDNIDVVSIPLEEVESSTNERKRKRASVSDQERPSSGKRRNRTNFSSEQVHYLETYFSAEPYPDGMQRRDISLHLHVSQQTITFWFQNRRARARRMAGNPTVLVSETRKRKEFPLQPATNWYFPLNSSNTSTPLPRKRDPPQPMTSSPIAAPLSPATPFYPTSHPYPGPTSHPYPGPTYPPTPGQATPLPHPYPPFQPLNPHPFFPHWILPTCPHTTSSDQSAGQMPLPCVSLPSVIEITPPPSVKGAEYDDSSNGSGGSTQLSPPLDSPLAVHNLVGRSC